MFNYCLAGWGEGGWGWKGSGDGRGEGRRGGGGWGWARAFHHGIHILSIPREGIVVEIWLLPALSVDYVL